MAISGTKLFAIVTKGLHNMSLGIELSKCKKIIFEDSFILSSYHYDDSFESILKRRVKGHTILKGFDTFEN